MTQPNLRGPIALSVAAAVLTIGMKAAAYLLTGSVGLFADALEGGINLVTAATAYFSLRAGVPISDLSKEMGHKTAQRTSLSYGHWSSEMGHRAALRRQEYAQERGAVRIQRAESEHAAPGRDEHWAEPHAIQATI